LLPRTPKAHLQSFSHHICILFRQAKLFSCGCHTLTLTFQVPIISLFHSQKLKLQLGSRLPQFFLPASCGLS
jgi:hypothetical protein